MKYLLLILVVFLDCSCGKNNYKLSKVIDGNTIQLENGSIVVLDGVSKSNENIKILNRYLKGDVLLYDRNNEEIHPSTSDVTAIVYNSDGDCINDLLSKVTQISKAEEPVTIENEPVISKTIVPMRLESGVYIIPAEINELPMHFVFDTGASLISISSSEADNLYSLGKLGGDDILGKSQFTDANGDISEGTIINLKSVKIGDRILKDVKACVIHGQNAPLLFGQSALMKFGKISIDYEKEEIVFE